MKFQLISDRHPIPSMTSAMVEAIRDTAMRNVKKRHRYDSTAGLESRRCDTSGFRLQLFGPQADAGAQTALKAGDYTTFDPPGSISTIPTDINFGRRESQDTTLTLATRLNG